MKFEEIDLRQVGTTIQLAGVLYADGERLYTLMLPGESSEGLSPVSLELTRENWETFIRQTDRVEVMAAVLDEHGTLGKVLVRKSERQISEHVKWTVFRRDFYRCRYCGTNEVPLTVDHLVLWEEGGPSIEANLVTACSKCNRTRGNMTYPQWLFSAAYKRVSANLPPAIREANERILPTLNSIPLTFGRKR